MFHVLFFRCLQERAYAAGMGWDLVAYFDLDQQDFREFLSDSDVPADVDVTVEAGLSLARMYLAKRAPLLADRRGCVEWLPACRMYDIWFLHSSSFLRDDWRLDNPNFIRQLEIETGLSYPPVLTNLNFNIRTKEDALEAVHGLQQFYGTDKRLMALADWLSVMATHCEDFSLS